MNSIRRHIPNFLTILRILLIAPFILSLAADNQIGIILLAIFILATDYFDGLLARRWHTITNAGKVLDPLADKICSASAAIALIHYRAYPLWLFLAIVARDVIILLAGLILIRRRRFVPVSNMPGKIAVGFISISLVVYVLNLKILKEPAAIATLAALIVSIITYALFFIKTIRHKEHAEIS